MNRLRFVALAALAVVLLASQAAAVPTPERVRFAAVGDFGMNDQTTGRVLDRLSAAAPDATFALGDLSYSGPGSENAWCDFVKARLGEGSPFEILTGNHESNGQDGLINNFTACLPNQLPGVKGTYGREYYVDYPADNPMIRFLMISPGIPFEDGNLNYSAGSARYNWTTQAIDSARASGIGWVVVGMHKPCISTGNYGCEVGTDIVNLLLEKRVDLVLSGHEHLYQRSKQLGLSAQCTGLQAQGYNPACVVDSDADVVKGAGTVFLTIGTGGVALRNTDPADPEAGYFAATSALNANGTHGFSDFEVTQDRLTMSFVRAAAGDFTDSLTIGASQEPTNLPPRAAFTANATDLSVAFDSSASTDPEGQPLTYAWDFGDGNTGSAANPTHAYATSGDYQVTLTVTDAGGLASSSSQQVRVTSPGPTETVLASDAFNRTDTNSWGSADLGGSWSVNRSNGVSNVDGDKASITMLQPNAGPSSRLGDLSTTDADVRFEYTLNKIPAGDSRVDLATLVRRLGGGDYRAETRVYSDGSVKLRLRKVVNGAASTIGNVVDLPGLTARANVPLMVRVQATGTSPTRLRVKTWLASTAEPAGWQISETDSTGALQVPGSVGLSPYLSSSATNAPVRASFDNLLIRAASTVQ